MDCAWDNKLVADLAAKGPGLRKAQVMCVRRAAAANQTGLVRDISDVAAIAHPARLCQGQRSLIDIFFAISKLSRLELP